MSNDLASSFPEPVEPEAAEQGARIVVPPSLTVTRTAGARREHAGAWTSVECAAAFLGISPVRLRRAVERSARRTEDGHVVANVDGIVARKLGRTWRVWLGPGWRSPTLTK